MPVSQTMTFTATPPITGETPTTFNYNAIACWNELKLTTVPNLNTAFTQMNTLEANVNAKEASTVDAANIASAAANFQGEWTSKGYNLGESVSSGGTTYMCKLTHATGFVVTNKTYWQPTGYAAIVNGATAKTVPVDADIIGIGDSAASFSLKKLTWANVKSTIISSFGVMISSVTAKNVPLDNDILILGDSADANTSKKLTLTNLKAMIFTSPALTGTPTAPTAIAGTNTTQVATTAFTRAEIPNMLNASGAAPMYACRAWVNFNGTGTVAIRASGNVSSITDNGGGDYTVNFTTAMPDVNYGISGISMANGVQHSLQINQTGGISTTTTRLFCNQSGVGNIDTVMACVSIFR